MADVDMPDAGPSAPSRPKGAVKSAKSGVDVGSDGKKRFEVKKVMPFSDPNEELWLTVSSGTPSLSGLGILSWTTVRFAETTLWICVSAGFRCRVQQVTY